MQLTSGRRMGPSGSEVGRPGRVPRHPPAQRLQTSPPQVRQGSSLRTGRRLLIEVDRKLDLFPQSFPQPPSGPDAAGHGDAADGHERNDVHGADPGMDTSMPGQIQEVDGSAAESRRRRLKARKGARQREDGPMVVDVGVPVEHRGAGRLGRRPGQFPETGPVAALADVDHALGQQRRRFATAVVVFSHIP